MAAVFGSLVGGSATVATAWITFDFAPRTRFSPRRKQILRPDHRKYFSPILLLAQPFDRRHSLLLGSGGNADPLSRSAKAAARTKINPRGGVAVQPRQVISSRSRAAC